MMRYCVIGFANIFKMPYLNLYLNVLKFNNICFDLIIWDRDCINENIDISGSLYIFNCFINDSDKKYKNIQRPTYINIFIYTISIPY
jgi:hypothetical protein